MDDSCMICICWHFSLLGIVEARLSLHSRRTKYILIETN